VAFIDLGAIQHGCGRWFIAFCKMLLVIFFFMHLRHSGGLSARGFARGFFSGWHC